MMRHCHKSNWVVLLRSQNKSLVLMYTTTSNIRQTEEPHRPKPAKKTNIPGFTSIWTISSIPFQFNNVLSEFKRRGRFGPINNYQLPIRSILAGVPSINQPMAKGHRTLQSSTSHLAERNGMDRSQSLLHAREAEGSTDAAHQVAVFNFSWDWCRLWPFH